MNNTQRYLILLLIMFAAIMSLHPWRLSASVRTFKDFQAHSPIHIYKSLGALPTGLTPSEIKKAYNIPSTSGSGTIAIIDAYKSPSIGQDLAAFNKAFGLAACTTANKCFEEHPMAAKTSSNSGWALETALDVEWAHAVAPGAKILLVEAASASGANLLKTVDYAAARPDVVAISMSWGGAEFADEASLDSHFTGSHAVFFASSGDSGAGASWPAASPYVVSVGGTSLAFSAAGSFSSERAWSGSGGGVSAYEKEPVSQQNYSIPKANGMRAIPDVSYNADPASGFSVYMNLSGKSKTSWYVVGGTSAGAPQWAAIQALGHSATFEKLYADKAAANSQSYFRDIISGTNGSCIYYCQARKHYDYVTGLGSPLTVRF